MWTIPRRIIITHGVGEGTTVLTAFDRALLDAGIADLNLVQVSSVLPPGSTVLRLREVPEGLDVPPGSLVPAVYGHLTSDIGGIVISSAIALGIPMNDAESGRIFEASILGDVSVACDIAERMVREALQIRGVEIREVIIDSAELKVKGKVGCALAAAIMVA